MLTDLSRRALLAAAAVVPVALATEAQPGPRRAAATSHETDLSDLERQYDARIGLFAGEAGGGRQLRWRSTERFAYCSTYKALVGAEILRRSTASDLNRVIHYSATDLVDYSPITSQHVTDGMTVSAIAEAAIRVSDNTAGNLLLREVGGPSGFQRALRSRGDRRTRSNRFETELNSAVPGDDRDTSDACTLAADLRGYLLGGWLDRGRASLLRTWMSGNATGDPLIRAGLPKDWTVADKSGAGSYGTRNDLAVVYRNDGPPLAIAVLSTKSSADAAYDNQLVVDVAARVAQHCG